MPTTNLDTLIKALQRYLNEEHGTKLIEDGKMGTKTYKAINDIQFPLKPARRVTAPASPRIAGSLDMLRLQIDTVWPGRNKSGDGWIGDAAHQSRKSDHNPWVIDSKGNKVVTALDITHDPKTGVDCNRLAKFLQLDPRVKYLIWNGQIFNPQKNPKWQKYKGTNPHSHHIHISVLATESRYDDRDPWSLA